MIDKKIDSFYEANYIQRYEGLTLLEKINKDCIFTYLDYKSKVNGSNYYGRLEINSMKLNIKWLKDTVCLRNPNYTFFTVKVSRHDKDTFLLIMKNLRHHMCMENDKLYFDIMNKYLVDKWMSGQFMRDPDDGNIKRINKSLMAFGVIQKPILQ
jgi:hypothetical protein